MKKRNLLFVVAIFSGLFSVKALDHGSMKGRALPIYPLRDGKAPDAAVADVTFDYKLVTIGTKTWAWTDWHGKTIAGNAWSSQYRYWTGGKVENNLTGRIAGTQQTYGVVNALPAANPSVITFLQEENNAFFETADFTYDYTKANSKDDGDTEVPVLAEPVINSQSALSLDLTLSATDNSGDYFYYIVDEANGFVSVSFFDNVKLSLVAGTQYTFSIYAIDFSGNMSTAKTITTQQTEAVYFTAGTAQALTFKLDSRSLTELVIECAANDYIGDAFAKLELNGVAIADKEWKPTINQSTGAKVYQIKVPANEVPGWAENAVLGLNLGYITMPIGDWGHYVVENTNITSGEYAGYPILHKIGTGIEITEPEPEKPLECDNNLLDGKTLSNDGENKGINEGFDIYFAPGWNPSANFSLVTVANGEYNITLTDATWEAWQAQFRFDVSTPIVVEPGKKYSFGVEVETNKSTPVFVKFFGEDGDNKPAMGIDRTTVNGTAFLNARDIVCPEDLVQISSILFDFGPNAENTEIKIKNIVICGDKNNGNSVDENTIKNISISQTKDAITINGENAITFVQMYTLSGQLIAARLNGNTIDTTSFANGIYMLKVKDAVGNQAVFKVMIK